MIGVNVHHISQRSSRLASQTTTELCFVCTDRTGALGLVSLNYIASVVCISVQKLNPKSWKLSILQYVLWTWHMTIIQSFYECLLCINKVIVSIHVGVWINKLISHLFYNFSWHYVCNYLQMRRETWFEERTFAIAWSSKRCIYCLCSWSSHFDYNFVSV